MAHSLEEFAAALAGFGSGYLAWEHQALEHACQIVEEEAKRVIGTYDYDWPQLAASTQEQRGAAGYAPNEPLLREGDLRASIEHTVDDLEHAGYVGSNSMIAVYQELGTSRIPPRSFLGGAARAKEHEIHEEISHSLHLGLAAALGISGMAKRGGPGFARGEGKHKKWLQEHEKQMESERILKDFSVYLVKPLPKKP